jgi:hypothetical protein
MGVFMNRTLLRNLQSKGVIFSPIHPLALKGYISDLQEGRVVEEVPYCFVSLSDEEIAYRTKQASLEASNSIVVTRDCTISWRLTDNWILHSWKGHPGPLIDDFIADFQTLDAVLEAISAYYFGNSTIINSWIVPLHQHPELDEERVRRALTQAQYITKRQFDTVCQILREQAQNISSMWKRGLRRDFLVLAHEGDTGSVCYLQRNAERAYIIRNSTEEPTVK